MSYPPYGGEGYPPAGGYGAPGYPQGGQPVMMPDPYGAPGGAGYPPQPGAPQIGFQSGYPPQGGYPPQPGYPPQSGYPPQGGYPAQGGYPPQAGYPPQGGYPAQGGYPPASGYPPQGGYPAQGGYPPPAQGGYPAPAPGGYPPQAGYPAQAGAGYPGQAPAQGYPGAPGGGYAPNQPMASGQPAGIPAKLPEGQGTVKPAAGFNAEEDAKVLRKAMKGFGTDEKAIIDVLSLRSNAQRQEIKNRFKTMYGKDLEKDLKSELSGRIEELVIALIKTPLEFDAEELREAMQGTGTDERALIEILCTRTNKQIQDVKATYKTRYSRDLEKDLMNETSGHFKRLLVSLSTGNRIENPNVDINKAKQDAMELYQAGEKKIGTDESKFNQILCSQSYEQLRAVFQEYKNVSKKGLDQVIKSEFSGDIEDGLLAVYTVVVNKHQFFAERLYKSMKGAGTKDRTLIRIIVSRCEVDMVQIKQEFQRLYGKTLESFIEGDTSGDYKTLLLNLVRGK